MMLVVGSKWRSHTCCKQHRPRDNLAFVANQVLENLKFSRQQVDFPATAAHRSRHEVELEIADAQHRFLDDGIAASGESLDTGQQFREGKRLDEVVIATGAQAAHPIVDLAERADDQGGRDDAVFPKAPDDRNSVDARKHAIDRHHGIVGRTSAAQSIVAVDSEIDLIAARREEVHELLGRFGVVFDDENAASPSYHDLTSPNKCARAVNCVVYHDLEPGNQSDHKSENQLVAFRVARLRSA